MSHLKRFLVLAVLLAAVVTPAQEIVRASNGVANVSTLNPISGSGSPSNPVTCNFASSGAAGCLSANTQGVSGKKTWFDDATFDGDAGFVGSVAIAQPSTVAGSPICTPSNGLCGGGGGGSGAIDGGYVDLVSNQTAAGNKTWAADAGVAGKLEVGSTITSDAAASSNAFAVSTNGARVDFGAGANDYASSDGTTVTYAGPLTSNGDVTGANTWAANGRLISRNASGGISLGTGGTAWMDMAAGSNVITFNSAQLTLNSASSITNAAPYTSTQVAGSNALAVTVNGARIDFGAGTNDYATSDGTNVNFAAPLTSQTNPVATSVNGQAGQNISGYHNPTDFVGHGIHVINGNRLTQYPIPSGRSARVGVTITKVGTVGGTFDVLLWDVTAGAPVCSRTGISCIASVGTTSASCTTDPAAIGDDLELRMDTTSCTGTDPAATADVMW